jgi:glycine/D-amino acid oxidase-like deaminating enzyme
MKRHINIAVLGAGIMGSCAALLLARSGFRVTLIDAASAPVARASRWNEGKIHLGYLYAADPTLRTARHVLPGSLAFRRLLEECVGSSIGSSMTCEDDLYLCHRKSVVSADDQWRYLTAVDALVRSHASAGDYLVDVREARSERLSPAELASVSGSPDIVAGFRVPERSVSTIRVATLLQDAVTAEPAITLCTDACVIGVRSEASDQSGPWRVMTNNGDYDGFGVIVNALWEGKLVIDRALSISPPPRFSHRFRRALFVRTTAPLAVKSALISTGPFGDIKNFGDRDFYMSWYPSGLAAYGTDVDPPQVSELDEQGGTALIDEVFENLGRYLPAVKRIKECMESVRIEGGWVYAAGRGRLADPRSSLHHRTDFGIEQYGSYFSIDTGKYCTAPWLAQRLAAKIRGN